MLSRGHGVQQDDKQAFLWIKKAVDGGNIAANYFMGLAYFTGRELKKDYK